MVADHIRAWLDKFKQANDEHPDDLRRIVESQKRKLEAKELRTKKKELKQKFEQQKRTSGFVYILRSENGYYKIGKAMNVKSRLIAWQRTFPVKIDLLFSFACNDRNKVEKILHRKYAKKRIEIEWYALDENDLRYLSSIKDFDLG